MSHGRMHKKVKRHGSRAIPRSSPRTTVVAQGENHNRLGTNAITLGMQHRNPFFAQCIHAIEALLKRNARYGFAA